MKLIKCIVRPSKTDDVVEGLRQQNVSGVTVLEIREFDNAKKHTAVYHGREYTVKLLPKMMIEVVADDSAVDEIVDTIMRSAQTPDVGDDRVFVLPIGEAYQIRTGKQNVI
jgi:nitrogen regulatory protein P-II 1